MFIKVICLMAGHVLGAATGANLGWKDYKKASIYGALLLVLILCMFYFNLWL